MSAVPDPSGHDDDGDADSLDAMNLVADGLLFVVPDDASALDADREAYYREMAERQAVEDANRARIAGTRSETRGLSGPLITALVLVVALVGSMMTVLAPRNAPAPAARPLARDTGQPAGQPGGLVPDVTLTVGPVQVLARTVRPAVFLLVPTDCPDCSAVVSAVLLQARTHRLQLVLVGPVAQRDQLAALDRTGASGQATLALDPSGQLATAYGASTPTVVIVAPDGIVSAVDPGVTRSLELDPDLFNALRRA